MDSPETTKTSLSASATSPPIKDSPFSSYVSTLSPIQYPNVSRPIGDLTFPSPEPVFTSPHITLARKSDFVRSSLSLTSVGRAKFSLQHSNDATIFPANVPRSGEHTSTSVVNLIHTEIESEGNHSCDHESCVISSSSLDASIADPSHICGNPAASSESLNQVAEMHKNVHRICTITDESRMESCKSDFARLSSVSPSGSALVDEFVTDPEVLSDSSDLQSKHEVVLSETVQSDCLTSQEMNARIHVSLASASAENDFAADEACFLGNPSLNDGESNTVDEAKEDNKALLDEQFESTTNNSYVAGHSFMEPAAGQQPEVDVVDQNRTNYVSSGLDNKGNGDAFHEKPSVISYYDSNARDLKSQMPSTHDPKKLAVDNDAPLSLKKNVAFSDNQIPNDEEITQNQRGMRKRLQFEVAENQKVITEGQGQSTIFSGEVFCKESLEISADMHVSNPSHLEPIEISTMKLRPQLVSESGQCKWIVKSDASGQKRGSSFATDHRPSGIGLHLNSIGSIGYASSTTVVQLLAKDSSVDDGSFLDGNDQLLQSTNCELVSTGLTREGSDKLTENAGKPIVDVDKGDNGDKILKHKTVELPTSSDSHQTPQCAKAIQCSMHSKHTNLYMTPCNLKIPLSTDNSKLIDSNQTSPRKKRKKASDEGQKRCSCKRSKCLKLYCDCFAAGTFCTEDCGCQQCVNKPENADTIRETKQQIESRNPLAFAPKVVLSVRDPPKDCEESVGTTPTSARHKRGCNCKKSLCLKKYCECYQAGVGCSFGCRCEDCKNIFGRRDGKVKLRKLAFGVGGGSHRILGFQRMLHSHVGCAEIIEIEHKKSKEHENIRESISKSGRKSGLSPLTPSIQFPSGVDAAKALVPISYYTSPETSASALPYYEGSPGSPLNSISKSTFEKESDIMARVPYPELDFDINVDTFSPGWDGFPDICNFSPMAKISPSNGDASTSSKAKEPKILQTRLFQGNPLALGPRWRCSPVTPLRQFGGSKIVLEPDSENGLNKTVDDDTPDILKETSSPTRAVSSTSPKQKRVSPPKRLLRESRSSSSSGRSGRKFILQAVPSFPPLTPYSNNNDRGSGI